MKKFIKILIFTIGFSLIALGIFLAINQKESPKPVKNEKEVEEKQPEELKPYTGMIYTYKENDIEYLAYDIENTTGQTINAKHLTLKVTSRITNEVIEKTQELTKPIKDKEKITIKFTDIRIQKSELENYLVEITLN